jgi:hypothetical protein
MIEVGDLGMMARLLIKVFILSLEYAVKLKDRLGRF